ncbi:MAG: ATP-binding protein [Streptococcaceae bacterium]|jgi:hypothetical protein|nr:ATP-binding protein [Streptococcaceae bacterium]
MEKIQLIPDASTLIESQRSIGYSFETALADILDNSISADGTHIEIQFQNQSEAGVAFVSIMDNGRGMRKEELTQALRYGSKKISQERAINDLGRFGLGLKMASFSQCRKLTVCSKQEDQLVAFYWDLDVVEQLNDWVIIQLNEEEIEKIPQINALKETNSGTIVLWEKFDKFDKSKAFELMFDECLNEATNHVALVFHKYIEEGTIEISFNGREVAPVNPYFIKNIKTQPRPSNPIRIGKNQIEVKPYIIPYQKYLSQEERKIMQTYPTLQQGLYIYRNKRLISWGKWFRLFKSNELANLAKISIEIPNNMDDLWEVDVKKSTIRIPLSVRDELKKFIKKAVGESKRVYKKSGRARNPKELAHVFNKHESVEGEVSYFLNTELPVYQALVETFDDAQSQMFDSLLKQIQSNIPWEAMRYDLANGKTIERQLPKEEEVYEEVSLLLSLQTGKASKRHLLNTLFKIENYQGYENILERIRGEIDD